MMITFKLQTDDCIKAILKDLLESEKLLESQLDKIGGENTFPAFEQLRKSISQLLTSKS